MTSHNALQPYVALAAACQSPGAWPSTHESASEAARLMTIGPAKGTPQAVQYG